ncbi:hypothetical protein FH972_025240 [Carpinus fangiana]|uniref:Uncharacterized protein n=1 Tax=Carpinus fangiana TaxID=176857 RepID=A0A5N6L310_9ROSI|nr:hypothetical protein FH972_025240 [Carpinus fangiana]
MYLPATMSAALLLLSSSITQAAHLSRGRYYAPSEVEHKLDARSIVPAHAPDPASALDYIFNYILRLTDRIDAVESQLSDSEKPKTPHSTPPSTTYPSISSISPTVITDVKPSQTPPVVGTTLTTYASVSSITPIVITDFPLTTRTP